MAVLVQQKAPSFTAEAVMEDGSFKHLKLEDYRGKYVILFFYPLDFTFVCPSEIIAFHNKVNEFKERNCEVIGVSVDSHFTHAAWRNTPVDKGGIGAIAYPLVADLTKTISANYDVLTGNGAVAYRGLFLIDTKGVVRHQIVNDLPLGRNVDEAIRMVDALQFNEKNGEVCPADWKPGTKSMKADWEKSKEYFSAVSK